MTLLSVFPICAKTDRSEPNTDVIEFRIKIQRMHAALATDARQSDSSKGSSQVPQEPAIYPSDADIHLLRDPVSPLQIAGPDRCGQAVLRVVRHVHSLFFRIERRNMTHRAEDFFFDAPRRFRKTSKDCGLNEEAIVERVSERWHGPARHDLCPFFARESVIGENLFPMLL